jgi:3-oxoacyl-[acyl-carrier-protein] synthase II
MGIICSAGSGVEAITGALREGRRAFSPINDPRLAHCTARQAGLVDDRGLEFPPDEHRDTYDRFVRLAAGACGQAIADARLDTARLGPLCGLIFATCSGPMQSIERHYERLLSGDPGLSADELFTNRYYSGAIILSRHFAIQGLVTTVVTACSASTTAVGVAADCIGRGLLTAAVAGGSDSFSATTLAGFDGLKATNDSLCAPFSRPIGLTLGEGSAFLVLEDFDHARQRGAAIIAEFLGYGLSNDAFHCSAPDPSGRCQALAMERALRNAGCRPERIEYINAHGTGTEANDKSETRALIRVFGERSNRIPVSSTKSIVGHCLGAAGSVELIASLAAARAGMFAPTAGFSVSREGCNLDYVPQLGRQWNISGPFMSNNFAFGGNNVSVVVTTQPQQPAPVSMTHAHGPACITGIGIVSPAGVGIEALSLSMSQNKRLRSMRQLPQGGHATVAAVPALHARDIDRRLDLRSMDPSSRFATLAARLALQSGRYPERPANLASLGFYLGLSAGPSWAESEHITSLYANNFHINQVHAFPYIVPNSVAGNVCRCLQIHGHNSVFCVGPGAGLQALGLAASAIEAGHCDAMLCGGVDELSDRIVSDAYQATPWPADALQVPGEGAAIFLLESETTARARGIEPLARMCGMAFGAAAATPAADSLAATIGRALASADITMESITAICGPGYDPRFASAVSGLLNSRVCPVLDYSAAIGVAEASLSLFTTAYTLYTQRIEKNSGEYYFLSVSQSQHGIDTVIVFQTVQGSGRTGYDL